MRAVECDSEAAAVKFRQNGGSRRYCTARRGQRFHRFGAMHLANKSRTDLADNMSMRGWIQGLERFGRWAQNRVIFAAFGVIKLQIRAQKAPN